MAWDSSSSPAAAPVWSGSCSPAGIASGSARRLHAGELDAAPVETAAFELAVATDGTVDVTPGPDVGGALGIYTPTLAHLLLDRSCGGPTGDCTSVDGCSSWSPRRSLPTSADSPHLLPTVRSRSNDRPHPRRRDIASSSTPFGTLPAVVASCGSDGSTIRVRSTSRSASTPTASSSHRSTCSATTASPSSVPTGSPPGWRARCWSRCARCTARQTSTS